MAAKKQRAGKRNMRAARIRPAVQNGQDLQIRQNVRTSKNEFFAGVDIEDVKRFSGLKKDNPSFLSDVYSSDELSYCFSRPSPAKHLAVRFCAKEAVTKALLSAGESVLISEISVLRKDDGAPAVLLPARFSRKFCAKISLSHTKDKAIAFAVVQRRIKEKTKR